MGYGLNLSDRHGPLLPGASVPGKGASRLGRGASHNDRADFPHDPAVFQDFMGQSEGVPLVRFQVMRVYHKSNVLVFQTR